MTRCPALKPDARSSDRLVVGGHLGTFQRSHRYTPSLAPASRLRTLRRMMTMSPDAVCVPSCIFDSCDPRKVPSSRRREAESVTSKATRDGSLPRFAKRLVAFKRRSQIKIPPPRWRTPYLVPSRSAARSTAASGTSKYFRITRVSTIQLAFRIPRNKTPFSQMSLEAA